PPWTSPASVADAVGDNVVVECTGETLALGERWQEVRVRLPPDDGEGCAVRLPALTTSGDTGGLLYSVTTATISSVTPSCVRPL
ncbi:MAG: hypothetical protein AAGE94_21500, partial [Acidobacteriota bacterium]